MKKLPRQIYSKLRKVPCKAFNSWRNAIQFYIHFCKDLKDLSPMLYDSIITYLYSHSRRPLRDYRASKFPGNILIGSGLPKAILPCSIARLHASQGSWGSISYNFIKLQLERFYAPELQAFEMMCSRDPAISLPPLGALIYCFVTQRCTKLLLPV